MTSITPEQLNLLIFRHLEESGFSNCASDLENEADIDRDGDRFPHGALLKLVQKGIQHCELEANLNQDEIRIDGEQLLHPFDLIKCNPVELQMILKDRKEKFQKGISKGKGILGSVQEEQRKQVKLDGNPILPSEFANIDVIVLPAHTSEVLACAWNPAQSLLASRLA